jgi:AcrR family transcriptional regulator
MVAGMEERIDGRALRYQHRRGDLLEAIAEYVLDNGVANLSMRRVADAVGVSHVTLRHHFGSKDELVAEIVEHLLERTLTPSGDYSGVDSANPLRALWAGWVSPAGRRDIRLFIEVLGQSLFDGSGYSTAVVHSIEHRLDLIVANLVKLGCPPTEGRLYATLLLGVLRGLIMDRLVTDDQERVDQAFEAVIEDAMRRVEHWGEAARLLAEPSRAGQPDAAL